MFLHPIYCLVAAPPGVEPGTSVSVKAVLYPLSYGAIWAGSQQLPARSVLWTDVPLHKDEAKKIRRTNLIIGVGPSFYGSAMSAWYGRALPIMPCAIIAIC